ncbi:hypothetical protein [Pseudomonas serbica]|jgi:hypothetical protein|uniref:hypothetical protein n=1 Tax=Pseudomonas serbica TaxID=2965074 RepID=UPI00237BFA75|nr:hypothetical protein [Pseudomonas serbica]
MSNAAKTLPQHQLQKSPPADCTEDYLAGWEYADWYFTNGGSLDAETPDSWVEEKIKGFTAYLAQVEREKVAAND